MQIRGFTYVTLYKNSEAAVMIGHYIIYFENILVFILSLCENITVAPQRCYIIRVVINILNTFSKTTVIFEFSVQSWLIL